VIKTYDTDTTALEDLSLGDGVRLDAVLTAQPTGLGMINDGRPLKQSEIPFTSSIWRPRSIAEDRLIRHPS